MFILKLDLQCFGGRGARQTKPSRVSNLNGTPLTDDQLSAVEYYVSGDGMYINDYLRDRNNPVERMGEMREMEKELIQDLDKATDAFVGNQTLYRAVDASAVFGNMSEIEYEALTSKLLYGLKGTSTQDNYVNNLINRTKGKTITDKGFMSTTKDYEIARDWGDFSGSSRSIVLEIKTTKSTKGLDLAKKASKLNDRMGQSEVLLKRNQSYTIKSVGAKDGNIYVSVEM